MDTITKVLLRFRNELQANNCVTDAAYTTCRGIYDEAIGLGWGEESAQAAFASSARIIKAAIHVVTTDTNI